MKLWTRQLQGLLLSAVISGIKSSCMDCGGLLVISQGHGVAGVRGCVVGEVETDRKWWGCLGPSEAKSIKPHVTQSEEGKFLSVLGPQHPSV